MLRTSLLRCLCGIIVLTGTSAYAERLEATVYPGPRQPVIDDQLQELENINTIPGNASLIDHSQWDDQRQTNIKDITDYVPGVFAQPRDGSESDRLSVRGSGLANTFQGRGLLILQDGVPINTADGEFEFPVIDPWLIRYAEIFPGANALEFGASSFGGAINFVTPTGVTNPGEEIRMEGGSFGTIHAELATGQSWQGGDLYAAISGFSEDGFRTQNNQDTERFNFNLGTRLSDNFTNRVYFSRTLANAEIPGAITKAQLEDDPTAANPNNKNNNYQRDLDITRVADKSQWVNGDNTIDSTIFYTYRHLDNPVTTYEFQHNNDFGIREKYTRQLGLDQFQIGVNSYYGKAVESRFQNLDADPGNPILTRNLYAMTNEIYTQYQQNLGGKLYGIIGAQGSYDTRDIEQFTPSDAEQNKTYRGFSPRLGLRYDIKNESQLFANLSRSFEPPTWSELSGGNRPGFFDLKAQRATTAEIGIRGFDQGFHWNAAYYHGWLRDEFVNYLFANGDTATINAARSKRDGIELGLNGDAAKNIFAAEDGLTLRAAYTFSHFTLDNDPLYGNNPLPGVPEHYLRAETLYHHPSGISFGPNVEWAPKASPVDLTNTLYTDGYALLGARAFWESEDKKIDIYVEGRNLLDKDYIATNNVIPNAAGVDGRYFYPGEGRAVYLGFSLKL